MNTLKHTMLRVGKLQRSIDFYTRVPGMSLLRTTGRPEQKNSLATAEARLAGPDGTLHTRATATCLVFELPG